MTRVPICDPIDLVTCPLSSAEFALSASNGAVLMGDRDAWLSAKFIFRCLSSSTGAPLLAMGDAATPSARLALDLCYSAIDGLTVQRTQQFNVQMYKSGTGAVQGPPDLI
jgi:hypothetical protein